jgi:Ca2+-binding RTX toxin-like protein
VQHGAGVDDKAKFYKDAKKYVDDGEDALTAVKAETERFLSYSRHGHDHKNYWRNVTWRRSEDLAWFNTNPRDTDGGDTIGGGDGNDVIFGQEGLDHINGGLGNDWLIGGSGGWNNKDVLTGGGGTDKLFQGDNDSKELRVAVQTAMPNWSSAFDKILPVVPFGANTELVKGHKEVDVDLLGFTASPWVVNNLMAAQAPGTLSPLAPPSAVTVTALVVQAKQNWLATGLADAALLDGIQVKLADLGGKDPLLLGQAQGNIITLDDDAAGWGWFADPSPALN